MSLYRATMFGLLAAAHFQVGESLAETLVVCPGEAAVDDCYTGDRAIQEAVDAASDGDTVLVKAGIYRPGAYRDVSFLDFRVRGYVLVDNKSLHLVGEAGTVLDGGEGLASSAFVIYGSNVTLENFLVRNFKVSSSEDDLYDGHGIFIIDSDARITDVTVENVEKMAFSIRGDSAVVASRIRLADNHLGIWMEENGQLTLENAVIRNSESAGVAVYDTSATEIFNSLFERNLDDGIYAENNAVVHVTNSIVMYNEPYGLRAVDGSHITAEYSILYANNAFANSLTTESAVIDADPRLDREYRPLPGSPALDGGDPDIRDRDDSLSDIGVYGGPGATDALLLANP